MGKIIDLTARLKTLAPQHDLYRSATEVFDYSEQKQKILFQERRQVKRTILTEFVNAMIVLPEKGLLKVSIFDLSEDGVSFDLPEELGQFKIDEEVSMRVYLNQKTYFPITVQIKHVTEDKDEAIIRHGSVFLTGASTDAALQYFVKFVESVSEGLKKDEGDLIAPKIS